MGSAFGHDLSGGQEVRLFTDVRFYGPTPHPSLETQLQFTLNVIPALTWYAAPSGALTFVNQRCADYLGLPEGHPLRLGIDMGAEWDSHMAFLHPEDHEDSRRAWATSLRTGVPPRRLFAFEAPKVSTGGFSVARNRFGRPMELCCTGSALTPTSKNANKQSPALRKHCGLQRWKASVRRMS